MSKDREVTQWGYIDSCCKELLYRALSLQTGS